MPGSAADLAAELRASASAADAAFLAGYFKTGPGGYAQGDVFIGVRVPAVRRIVARFSDLPADEVAALLQSAVHEDRLAALLVLVAQFQAAGRRGADDERLRLHRFYVDAVLAGRVDNWDLVDSSAEYLVGEHLVGRDRTLLMVLARSPQLWERRVGVLSTFAFLKHGDLAPIFELAPLLFDDREDLIHKAVGWMLREGGKRVSRDALMRFLDEHAPRMPRTMLSYATEHLPAEERARYRAMPRRAGEPGPLTPPP